jgi:hypothetical protein
MQLEPMTRVRQRFESPKLDDVAGALRRELSAVADAIRPGETIAVAVGSRGMANLPLLARETVDWLRWRGAQPFIVPAMGSHGGATAEGQRDVLATLGVTEQTAGAPVRCSMDVIELPRGDLPCAVFFSSLAAAADGVVLINRVKPHTSFHGPHESGLLKMIAVGLGNHQGARAIHRLGVAGLREVMPRLAHHILRTGHIRLGIAVVENARDETAAVRVAAAGQIAARDAELLELARDWMPRLPVESLDVLIVDELGKDISGSGLDTNLIGRIRIAGQPEPDRPRIRMIVARALSAATRGNAYGVGLADVITRRLHGQIDWPATYANVLTTGFLERGKIPIIAGSDREALDIAWRGCQPLEPAAARVIRIRNTLRLDELHVSPAVLAELRGQPCIEIAGPVHPVFRGEELAEF